ncbi:hypothetical protein GGH12_002063 [Coemansia sp. RSA 1822]|nr:hypothetical protein LPJ76_000951 [Coemansia sp. RSA 638]KAJ2564306.1 hypothetical protein GGH12_002063 [Coemansia sp. RSA 1822]
MLSGPTEAVTDKTDGQSWLPEFDTHGISLDLPLDLPPLSLADTSSDKHTSSNGADQTLERPNRPAPPASPLPEADVYANFEYASIASADDCPATDNAPCAVDAPLAANAESPQLPAQPVEPVQIATPKAPASPFPDTSDSGSFIDRLGLDFDFHTDPAIDEISTSSLFVAPVQELSVDSGKNEPNDLSAQRKAKARRTSIAGLLMRRASKYVDAAASAVEAPDFSAVCAASFSEPVANLGDTSKDLPVAASGSASVHDEAANGVPSDAQSAVSAGEPQGGPSSTSSQLDVAYSIIERPEGQDETATNDSESQSEAAPATDDVPSSHSEPVADQDSETDPVDSDSLPAPTLPMARTVEKRSSRILSGITRKVNHVRQTTSMVLRRSVGSRLSIAPGKSVDNVKQSESLGADQSGGQDEPPKYSSNDNVTDVGASIAEDVDAGSTGEAADGSDMADADVTDAAEMAEDVANTVDTANSTESVDTGEIGSAADASNTSDAGSSNAETASSSSSAAESDNAANDSTSSIDAAETPEPDTSDHEESLSSQDEHRSGKEGLDASDKDGLDAKPTFSRRLGMVRRGTNEAVRNGVSRVKHIFASKRPVAA